MSVSVKKKIWLGTLFLFLLLLVTGGVGIYYMAKLKAEGKNVLKDNYESLSYCHTMQQQLQNLDSNFTKSIKIFNTALHRQEQNITEQGEDKVTVDLRSNFNKLIAGDTTRQNLKMIEV